MRTKADKAGGRGSPGLRMSTGRVKRKKPPKMLVKALLPPLTVVSRRMKPRFRQKRRKKLSRKVVVHRKDT